jgi:hypothetical protein
MDLDDDDYDSSEESGIPRFAERRSRREREVESFDEEEAIAGVADIVPIIDVARLKGVLEDLIACRRLLDTALKDG